MRHGNLSVLVLTLLALPLASAQAPSTTPTSSLVITGLPTEIQGLESNATVEVPFTLDYRITGNFLCAEATRVPITINFQQGGQASYIAVLLEPSEVGVDIAPGPHQNAQGAPEAKLTITLAEINANASIPLTVSAEAGAVQCAPTIPAATAEPVTTFANVTYEPPAPPPPPPAEETPGAGVLLVAAGVAVAATVMRRRRA